MFSSPFSLSLSVDSSGEKLVVLRLLRLQRTKTIRKRVNHFGCPSKDSAYLDAIGVMDYSDDEERTPIEPQTPKEPCQISAFNGTKFVEEVLNGPNENCCKNFRMDTQLFYKFCDILQAKGLLRHTNRIKIEEQLAIFLFTVGHNQRTRAVQERFQYSGETISRHFNNVLNAILTLSLDYFLPPGFDTPQEILNDSRFYPYFKDCVGAVDGTHIPVMVGVDEQGPFRNKNGYLSQNVMAACSFDSQFQYVLAGWEGSATDSRILGAALTRRNKLHVPEGKYYLVDTNYPNMPGFLSPYLDAPYYNHLNEFSSVDEYPQNAKELFNYRHSLLRNAINHAFKGLKTRFPILMSAPPYPLQTQVKLVIATCIIHNFIAKEKGHDWLLSICEDGKGQGEIEPPTATTHMETSLDPHFSYNEIDLGIASEVRDAIAAEMWNDHIQDFSTV